MKQIYHDEKYIASDLIELDKQTVEASKLAHQKVATLKLSYIHEAYKASRGELRALVKRTLLNYVTNLYILSKERFFLNYNEN